MDWEQVRNHVESQIGYWRAVGKQDRAEALELCLAKAERCQAMHDVVMDLRHPLTPGLSMISGRENLAG
jgi:hypothetical protein